MALSSISVMSNALTNITTGQVIKATNVDFLATIGPFTTTFSGTAGSYVATTQKTITGTQYYNGLYQIKCNLWLVEGTLPSTTSSNLGFMFDNNNSTYGSSVFSGGAGKFNYAGNQVGFGSTTYDTNGNYTQGATYYTTYITNYVGDYIDVFFPMPIIMKKYRIMTRVNALARYPRQLYFFGSNDGTNWGLLHSYLNPVSTANTYTETTFPTTTTSYTKYRMVINSVNSGGGGFWNIANLNMIFDVV